jgi:glucose repression mediator protein
MCGAGSLHASMGLSVDSLQAHEAAIRNNPHSTPSLKACAHIHRKDETREGYMRAIEYLQRALNVEPNDGDAWGSLGYCYLMVDDVQKAFTAYQQALYLIPAPKDPYLWYGLGILYERYNSYDQADEYFTSGVQQLSVLIRSAHDRPCTCNL